MSNDEQLKGRTNRRRHRTGPRGGTSTRTETGLVKKNLWMPHDLAQRVRDTAFRRRVSEAEIIRAALAQYLSMLLLFAAMGGISPSM